MAEATLVYDDDCGFCTWWAEFLIDHADVRVVGFSELDDHPEVRERLPEDYEQCSHLLVDGEVHSCGASIEQALARSDLASGLRPLVGFLRQFEDYERIRERVYRTVAEHRDVGGQFVSAEPPAGQGRAGGAGAEDGTD
ncbi:MAG: thiol-disulfide oxidoreductase DCC family protein [Haloferacaceae archaeon]